MLIFIFFFLKYLVNSEKCCTFAAENIPRVGIMDWGVPGWKGLSVRAILFLYARDNLYTYLFQILCIDIVFYYFVSHIRFIL